MISVRVILVKNNYNTVSVMPVWQVRRLISTFLLKLQPKTVINTDVLTLIQVKKNHFYEMNGDVGMAGYI